MKESLLYELGGRDQAGACESVAEAHAKVGRLLDGDMALAAKIAGQQRRILEHFSWEHCVPEWKRVLAEHVFVDAVAQPARRRRIGVFLPVASSNGLLRMAVNQALMLKKGSEAAGQGVDVVFSYVQGDHDSVPEIRRLAESGITSRETRWREIPAEELRIANKFRGVDIRLDAPTYVYPTDGASNFLDCDFWHVVSDRTAYPLAPVRPYSVLVTDCLQRYAPGLFGAQYEAGYHGTTRHAALVLCSSASNRDDVIQYVGIPARSVAVYPLEFDPLPFPAGPAMGKDTRRRPYFIWTTDTSSYQDHETALRGIRRYFERLDGQMDVVVTGVDTEQFDPDLDPGEVSDYIRRVRLQVARGDVASNRIKWAGTLDQDEYAWTLRGAQFLFDPSPVNAGTLCAVEAAGFDVPTVSSDNPQMRFCDQRFSLGISFFESTDENDIARALKEAESTLPALKQRLPSAADLARFSPDRLAPSLWNLVRQHVQ